MRIPKRDQAVDALRTMWWFAFLKTQLGQRFAVGVQRIIEPELDGLDADGVPKRNDKHQRYDRGENVPYQRTIDLAEQKVRGSARLIQHVLWEILKRGSAEVARSPRQFISRLALELQARLLDRGGHLQLGTNVYQLRALSKPRSMDGLAAVTILFMVCRERQDEVSAAHFAILVWRQLLLVGREFNDELAPKLFELFKERIFDGVQYRGYRFDFSQYDYVHCSRYFYSVWHWVVRRPQSKRSRRNIGVRLLEGRVNPSFLRDCGPRLVPIDEKHDGYLIWPTMATPPVPQTIHDMLQKMSAAERAVYDEWKAWVVERIWSASARDIFPKRTYN